MHADRDTLMAIYDAMLAHFGHRGWWPGRTPLEICLGAILTQNTNWKNVERAIANLHAADAMDAETLAAMPRDELAGLIRPSGYYNVKAGRLGEFVRAVVGEAGGDVERFLSGPVDEVRTRLLAIRGIGPETADSMALYAGGLATFVVDAYTMRVFRRHGLIAEKAGYEEVRGMMQRHLPADVELYNDYHAQLVEVGKRYCRPREPRCEACPLVSFLRAGTQPHAADVISPGDRTPGRAPASASRSRTGRRR